MISSKQFLKAGGIYGVLIAGALAANPAQAAMLAYYPLDSASPTTPDLAPGGTAYNATLVGTAAITSGGMFGNALSSVGSTNRAEVADIPSPTDFDRSYNNFSLSLWIKPDSVDTTTNRWITGKGTNSGTATNRGWDLSTVAGASINQVRFTYARTTTSGSAQVITTSLGAALSSTDYTHVAVLYDNWDGAGTAGSADADTFVQIYINGILAASQSDANIQATLNGSNGDAFQIGNRGDTVNTTTDKGFKGFIDDYALFDDTRTQQTVALTHGLGRLAAVSLGDLNQSATNSQILDVLAAYNTTSSAVAGTGAFAGTIWQYNSFVGVGQIGTIGGSVAGGDAFIVLGTSGEGVSVVAVPEPTSLGLALVGVLFLTRLKRTGMQRCAA